MSDPSSSSSSSTLSVGSSSSSTSTSTSTSNTNDSVRPRGFHSRLSSLDETRKATWMPAEVENFDELDALEDRIRTTDLIKDHNMDKSPQCPKTVNGGALVSWFISQKLAANRQAALALGQRLVDAHKMFNVEPRTNRRLHQDFDGDPDSLWRFEVDRACGADPVRAYSLTKFYFAKINSHSGHLHCVGVHRLTPFFGVLSREDCTIYMFRNPEAGKPYDDVYLKRAAYFIADQMETPHNEKKHKEDVGRRGSYLGLVTSSRNVLLACPSPQARDQWVAELDKVHMKLIEPPAKVSAETVNQIVYDNNLFPPHTPKTPIGTARNLSLISEAPSPQLIDQLLHDTERVKLNDSASLSPRGRGTGTGTGTASTTTSVSSASSSSSASASSSSAATSATATAAANANVGAAGAGAGAGNKTGTSTASSFTPRSATGSGASNDATEAKQSNFDPTSEAWKTQRAATEAKRQLSLMIPFLGFSFDAVEENDNPFDGLLVDVVEPDTPAERAGLRRGDVVLQVNGMRTLTLPDLKHAIRNQYPGACLDVFGERDSKPLHLAMIIGAKGVPDEHVAQLRAIIEEAEKYAQGAPIAHTPKNLEEDESGVTLADVLETPQWRMVLLNYMEINLCAESLNFLTAEQAYQRIPDSQSERRSYAARLICDEFIDERGDQMVNLDNDTRKTVMAKISLGDFAPMLFHEAAKVVYKMVETDVFRRFIHTEEYKEMLSDPFINQSESLQKHRRKANSFVVIALEERTSELDLIAAEFTKTGVVQDRRYHLKKYKSCFTGAQLVDFLIEQGYCKNRPGGVSVGQRMHDANILRHVNDECEFEDSDKFFTFLRSSVSEGPSVIQLFQKARSQNGTLHSGYLLLKGVHYNRVYCVLFKEKKKLYIYRTHTSPAPNIKLRLKGATYKSFSDSKSVAASTSNLGTNGTLTSAVDDVPTEVDKFYKLARGRALPGSGSTSGISGIKREPITYLQIETQTKACTFRIEGTADAEAWQQGIQKAGATLAKD